MSRLEYATIQVVNEVLKGSLVLTAKDLLEALKEIQTLAEDRTLDGKGERIRFEIEARI